MLSRGEGGFGFVVRSKTEKAESVVHFIGVVIKDSEASRSEKLARGRHLPGLMESISDKQKKLFYLANQSLAKLTVLVLRNRF